MKKDKYRFVSGIYDHLTSLIFLGSMSKAKITHLDKVKTGDRVLILGGGTGLELGFLIDYNPELAIDYVEASDSMLARAMKRIPGHTKNVRFFKDGKIPNGSYEIIITSFFMDLFKQEQMEKRAEEIIHHLSPGGKWIITDFEIQKNNFWQPLLTRTMYSFFSWFSGLKTNKLPDFTVLRQWKEIQEVDKRYFYAKFIFAACLERI